MTAYRSIITDYPKRVLEAWEAHIDSERKSNREVSFTLATIAASVGTPLELLGRVDEKPQPLKSPMNAVLGTLAQGSLVELDRVREANFFGSELGPPEGFASWRFGRTKPRAELASLDAWPELRDEAVPAADLKCWEVLRVLRHSAAHAGIRVRGKQPSIDQIVLLNFYSVDGKPCFSFLAVSPRDLEAFVRGWKSLVERLEKLTPSLSDALRRAEAA